MKFNGVDLSPYLKIRSIKGRGYAGKDLTLQTVPGMAGSHLQQTSVPSRVLTIEADIIEYESDKLRNTIEELNSILDVDGAVEVIFSDEEDRVYYGIPESVSEGDEHTFIHKGTITIVCPDPYKYGLLNEVEFPSDVISVINGGTHDAQPVFELEVLAPVTFAMIQNQNNEYIMVGRPFNVEYAAPFIRYERVFSDDASSLIGWTDALPGEIDGTIAGTMTTNGYRFQPSDFGPETGSWHGPAIKTSLPKALTDFRMESIITLSNTETKDIGRVEVYLLDASGRQVCKVSIRDMYGNQREGLVDINIESPDRTVWLIAEAGDNDIEWNDFYGVLRIEREGDLWSAYAAQINRTTGKHSARRHEIYRDRNSEFQRSVAQVVVHVSQHSGYQRPVMGVESVVVWEVNQNNNGVPYIANVGDIIAFDHTTEEILINGELRKDIKNFGATYFDLITGENQLIVNPSSSFKTNVKYRERFR